MKKKKFVPPSGQSDDFTIFALSSDLPDYTLAFRLNKQLEIHLQKEADLQVFQPSSKSPKPFSFYFCESDRDRNLFLIHSLADQNTLMKSYFLILQGFFQNNELKEMVNALNETEGVLSVNRIIPNAAPGSSKSEKLKSDLINATLTDLEYHMLEVKKREKEQKVQLKTRPGKRKVLYR